MLGMRSSHVDDHPMVPVCLTGRTDTFWDGLGYLSGTFCPFKGLRNNSVTFKHGLRLLTKMHTPQPTHNPRRRWAVQSSLEVILVEVSSLASFCSNCLGQIFFYLIVVLSVNKTSLGGHCGLFITCKFAVLFGGPKNSVCPVKKLCNEVWHGYLHSTLT